MSKHSSPQTTTNKTPTNEVAKDKFEENIRQEIGRDIDPDVDLETQKEADKLGFERLLFFSDAVFAIAITLLALDIRLPPELIGHELNNQELASALTSIWPKYFSYIFSFFVIGLLWVGHHTKFRHIRRFDSRLLTLNLLTLMGVAFLPFPTSVLSEYGNTVATIFYAAAMVIVGLLSTSLWAYASHRNQLVDANLNPAIRRSGFIGPLLAPIMFLISIGIALVNDDWARMFWVLILPLSILVR